MCRIFSGQNPEIYKVITRSVRLNGFSTSIRLEALFWSILDEIAAGQNMTTPRFISTLYDEVLEEWNGVGNFTSLLRVTCMAYANQTHHQQHAEAITGPAARWRDAPRPEARIRSA